MIVSDLIQASLRKIGALSTGEIPSSYTETLQALQVMLRSWAQRGMLVFSSTRENFNLTPSQSLYTWGASGNITSARPHQILSAFVRDSNGVDHEIRLISEGEYNAVLSKSALGRPSCLFYHPTFPLGNVFVYPTPQVSESLHIESLKPFTETSSFSAATDTLSFPPNYEEALIYNLAIRLAPELGITISQETSAIANTSYSYLTTLNSANAVEPVCIKLPVGHSPGRRYDINAG